MNRSNWMSLTLAVVLGCVLVWVVMEPLAAAQRPAPAPVDTRREVIAAAVLPVFIAKDKVDKGGPVKSHRELSQELASLSLMYADALIQELDKKPEPGVARVPRRPTPVYQPLGRGIDRLARYYDSQPLVIHLDD